MSYIGNSPGVASQRIVTIRTATAGQTEFFPDSGYVLGYIDVIIGGVDMTPGVDYTANDGVKVVLTEAAEAGEIVKLIAYIPRGLSDGYLKSEADALLALKADLVGGKIPSAQLPAYVDDVLEFDNLASFPATGEFGKIYVDKTTNATYRWSGSTYIVLTDLSAYYTSAQVNSALALKADKSTTYTKTETDNLLSSKANTTDVNTALALKANTTDVNTALALKANTTDVNTALALKLNLSGGVMSGALSNTTSIYAPIFYDINNTGYYVDPDGTTNLNILQAAGQRVLKKSRWKSITVGGDLDKYYPVVFDVGTTGGMSEEVIEIVKQYVHYPTSGWGAGYCKFVANQTGWGNFNGAINVLSYYPGGANRTFSKIRDVSHWTGLVAIWVRGGGLTYEYRTTSDVTANVFGTNNQAALVWDRDGTQYDIYASYTTSVEDSIFNSNGTSNWSTPINYYLTSGNSPQCYQGINTSAVTVSAGQNYTIASVSIAPRSTSSKILVTAHVSGYQTYDTVLYFQRNGTTIGMGDAAGSRVRGFGELGGAQRANEQGVGVGFYLDTPATTSTLTYSLIIYNRSTTAYINRSAQDDDTNYDSRTTSTITVLEILG